MQENSSLEYDFSDIKPSVETIKQKKKKIIKYKKTDENGNAVEDAADKPKKGEFGVWIGNLSYTITRKSLFEFFKTCGHITRIKLPVDAQRKNKGFAYVDFESEQVKQFALRLSERELEGRRVLIKSADDFEANGKKPRKTEEEKKREKLIQLASNSKDIGGGGGDDRSSGGDKAILETKEYKKCADECESVSRKLFVGNLGFDTTKEQLEELFGKFGTVEKIRLSVFDDTQRCKGFAHVLFQDETGALKVKKKKHLKLDGRVLRIEFGRHQERTFPLKRKEPKLALPSDKRQKIVFSKDDNDTDEE